MDFKANDYLPVPRFAFNVISRVASSSKILFLSGEGAIFSCRSDCFQYSTQNENWEDQSVQLFTLIFTPLSFWTTPTTPPQCPPSGYIETLVEPAVTEDGFVKVSEVYYKLSAEQLKNPAKFKVMTQDEYDALDEMMTYTTYKWHSPKYSKTPIVLVTDVIAEYDIILTPDGNMFHRPLEASINKPLFIHEVEVPERREKIDVSEKRPEPEKLGKGQLKVMMSPEHYEFFLSKYYNSLNWRSYVKSRTPAIYQQERCDHGK